MTQVNNQPPVNPPAPLDPDMSIADLMTALFNAAAGLYTAIQGSLQEQNQNISDLNEQVQAISDKLGQSGNRQETINLLKGEMQELQSRLQKANATMQTNLSAATTDVAILGKWVATMKQAIDGVVPNM